MASNTREYDLQERLIGFAVAVLDLVDVLPRTIAGAHIAGQLVRSGTSPAGNYAEAEGAESRKDFVHKLRIVLKELRESRVWLIIISRRSMIQSPDIAKRLLQECDELVRIIAKSIATTKQRE